MDARLRPLIEAGLVAAADLDDLETAPGEDPVEALLATGRLDEAAYLETVAGRFGIEVVDPAEVAVGDVLALAEADILRSRRAVVLPSVGGGRLRVAIVNPLDLILLDELHFLLGAEVEPVLALPRQIDEFLARLPGSWPEPCSEPPPVEPPVEEGEALVARVAEGLDPPVDDEDADPPVVGFVARVLLAARKLGASHVVFEPGVESFRIRLRLAATGDWVDPSGWSFPLVAYRAVVARLKILGMLDIAERRLPQAGRLELVAVDEPLVGRISTLPSVSGEEVAVAFPAAAERVELALPPALAARLATALDRPGGLVLVVGNGGEARSAILAALAAGHAASPGKLIAIAGGPDLERYPEEATRLAIRHDLGLGGERLLRQVDLHAPTAVALDCLPSCEVARELVARAADGLRAYATLPVARAGWAVRRLLDMGVDPFLVASGVRFVLGQQLLRTLCPDCRRPTGRPAAPFEAVGCPACFRTGFSGRRAVFEGVAIEEADRQAILEGGRPASGDEEIGRAAADLVAEGWTTPEEVARSIGGAS